MVTYIKNTALGFYVELEEELNPNLYTNIGTTFKDFTDGLWVKLTPEQLAFKAEHPEADVEQVFNMTVPTPVERTLEDAKNEKIADIDAYDNSEAVNGFSIDGIPGTYWFTAQERTVYKQSIDSAKLLNKPTVSVFLGETPVTLPVEKAEYLMAVIQDYADNCSLVTTRHKLTVQKLDSIEKVDTYNFTIGYPKNLELNLRDPEQEDVEYKEVESED